MTPEENMHRLDELFSHVWMVRTFLKHSEEAEDDEELREVHRELYDVMHSLGPSHAAGDAEAYQRQAKKKQAKLQRACELFVEIQPEISEHMNFKMARQSLQSAVREISGILVLTNH